MKRISWESMSPAQRKPWSRKNWANVAKIHAKIDGGDWLAHQIMRFVYEGYASETTLLIRKLQKVEPQTMRTRALQMLLQSEKKHPTPFGGLIPFGQMYRDR